MITNREDTYIERAPKDRDNPYGMLRRAPFDGSPLSFEARGVLAYVLMKPDNWRVNISDLRREGNISRDKAYAIVNELIEKGYAERIQKHDEEGHFAGTSIKIYEQPFPENPYTVTPDTDAPYTENKEHNNNGVIPTTDLVIKTDKKTKAAPHPMTKPIIETYIKCLGYTPAKDSMTRYVGPQAKECANRGITPDEIEQTYVIMSREEYWRDKTISLSKILDRIEKTKATIRNRNGGNSGQAGRTDQANHEPYYGRYSDDPERDAKIKLYHELHNSGRSEEAAALYRELAGVPKV